MTGDVMFPVGHGQISRGRSGSATVASVAVHCNNAAVHCSNVAVHCSNVAVHCSNVAVLLWQVWRALWQCGSATVALP
jgi:hypothetical protein